MHLIFRAQDGFLWYYEQMAKLSPNKLQKLKDYFTKRDDVSMAFLFGSYAKGTATKRSDADIAVYFKPAGGKLELTADVDYPQESEVWSDVDKIVGVESDLVILNRARPTLAFEIIRFGEALYINDHDVYFRFLSRISFEAIDYYRTADEYWRIFERSASLSPNDRTRLIKLLTFLKEEMEYGNRFKALTSGVYTTDPTEKRVVERWVENVVNCSIDIAKTLLASEHIALPNSYKEMLTHLRRLGEFDGESAKRLGEFAELRNILAHEYLDSRFIEIRKFIDEAEPLYQKLAEFARGFLEK